jgi:hypothetical protein
VIEVFLPYTRLCSPNISRHWAQRHSANKRLAKRIKNHFLEARKDLQARKILNPTQSMDKKENCATVKEMALVTILYIHPRAAQMDDDNRDLCCKHVRDTVAAIMIPGLRPGMADGDKRIQWQIKQEKGAPREYSLKITIEAIP